MFATTIGLVAPVEDSWTRIVTWLAASAPATRVTPAAAWSGDEVAVAMGRPLPTDLVTWWRLLDSAGPAVDPVDPVDPLIPAGHALMSMAEALAVRGDWLDRHLRQGISIVDGQAGDPEAGFQSGFLPFARNDDGRFLFVDLRDGPLRGCVAEWDGTLGFDDAIHWPSVTDMLSDLADAMTHGTPALTFHAAGRLRHFPADPDVLVDTYRATVTPAGRLTWAAESF